MIPITKIDLGKKEIESISKVLKSGWIMNGPITEHFENKIAQYTQGKYAVAVSSGTAALYLSLKSAGVGMGDEVITPSYSFVSSAYVINLLGATPVFCDVDPKTFNISVDNIKRKLTKKTKVVILVHQFGLPCDLDPIYALTKERNFTIIEDAACALGSSYKNRKVGQKGNYVCFSFHPRKVITTGEGGAIVTSSKSITEKLKSLRNHGLINNKLTNLGFNCRITDIQSAIGLVQLSKLNSFLSKRKRMASYYNKHLANSKYFDIPFVPEYATPNWQSYAVSFKKNGMRDKILKALKKKNIIAKEGIPSIHKQPYYKKQNISLPNTEYLENNQLLLPIYPTLTQTDQGQIIHSLKEILNS